MPREPEDDDLDLGPPGPVVVLDRADELWAVFYDPPMPDGEHRVTFATKDAGWGEAMCRARRHRLGFRDDANFMTGNRNAARK